MRHSEGHFGHRVGWLRAMVLGANDGIISTAALLLGVAAADSTRTVILTAGTAGLVAGAVSMALGEYVSVSSQRDTERAAVAKETRELAEDPEGEFEELVGLFQNRGLTRATAEKVAEELTAQDALAAHSREELKIEPGEYVNPWAAALSSLLSFTVGAALPLIAILVTPASVRIWVTFLAVLIALFVTGWVSARLVGAPVRAAVARNVIGGALAMAITYGIGALLGTSI